MSSGFQRKFIPGSLYLPALLPIKTSRLNGSPSSIPVLMFTICLSALCFGRLAADSTLSPANQIAACLSHPWEKLGMLEVAVLQNCRMLQCTEKLGLKIILIFPRRYYVGRCQMSPSSSSCWDDFRQSTSLLCAQVAIHRATGAVLLFEGISVPGKKSDY